ncbi:hypothetical protein GCM10010346_50560 [Streptomyces chryseus]|uniref:Uncharacterized protein n=1 Tax=Streptomyces chryseus TaxID=68186 RepID=A0ABQ3E1N9_9ACTN|nr:hypothetical protein GCM10010346_50560 [Streptomyces chryseus]
MALADSAPKVPALRAAAATAPVRTRVRSESFFMTGTPGMYSITVGVGVAVAVAVAVGVAVGVGVAVLIPALVRHWCRSRHLRCRRY